MEMKQPSEIELTQIEKNDVQFIYGACAPLPPYVYLLWACAHGRFALTIADGFDVAMAWQWLNGMAVSLGVTK